VNEGGPQSPPLFLGAFSSARRRGRLRIFRPWWLAGTESRLRCPVAGRRDCRRRAGWRRQETIVATTLRREEQLGSGIGALDA